MLNTDERLYYAGAGETLKTLLLHVYQEEALKKSRKNESDEQAFANRAKQIAVGVRDAYLTLLHVPLPQRGGDFDLALSQKIAKNLNKAAWRLQIDVWQVWQNGDILKPRYRLSHGPFC